MNGICGLSVVSGACNDSVGSIGCVSYYFGVSCVCGVIGAGDAYSISYVIGTYII